MANVLSISMLNVVKSKTNSCIYMAYCGVSMVLKLAPPVQCKKNYCDTSVCEVVSNISLIPHSEGVTFQGPPVSMLPSHSVPYIFMILRAMEILTFDKDLIATAWAWYNCSM